MSDSKKYYYLKLKDNFFDSDEMIVLESMQDGYLYSNILLKLYLRSLKNEGRLMFNDKIPYNSTMLAQITRHQVGTVEKAVQILKEIGLIEVLDNGAIYVSEIQNFIGQSSTEADRKRTYRERIKSETKLLMGQMSNQMSGHNEDISPPEIEKEKELEKEIYKNIVEHLNSKSGKSFKHSTSKTKSLIDARMNEGFTLDDFKKVIDIKVKEWKETNMDIYLRPETLFSNKFEGYLNQKEQVGKKSCKVEQANNFNQRETAEEDYEKFYS